MRNVPDTNCACPDPGGHSFSRAEKYTGPRPPKADVPYLLHADNLIETEIGKAKSDERKDTVVASSSGRDLTCENAAGRADFPNSNG